MLLFLLFMQADDLREGASVGASEAHSIKPPYHSATHNLLTATTLHPKSLALNVGGHH